MKNPVPTVGEDELTMVKDFLLLPILLDVLERDVKAFRTIPLKMPDVYIKNLRAVQDQAMVDLTGLRRMLRERGVKIYEQNRTPIGLEANYLCRGYHHQFSMLWGLVRAEIESRLATYLHVDLTSDDR